MNISLLQTILLVPLTLLPIMNPLGNAPAFAGVVAGAGAEVEKKLARQVALNCLFLLSAALLAGSHVLHFFGLTLPAVRLGGGLLVAAAAWRLLNDSRAVQNMEAGPAWSEAAIKTRSFYPISFPLTAGPGSIAAAIALATSVPNTLLGKAISLAGAVLGLVITVTVIYFFYRYATRVVRLFGEAGTAIIRRLFAFISLCMGLQAAWQGAQLLAASSLIVR